MATFTMMRLALVAGMLAMGTGTALAQQEHQDKSGAAAKAEDRVGDPYPLAVCPTSGKKLGGMGDPVIKVYSGQEVRFCCAMCPPGFEKNTAANIAKVDAMIIKDQAPLYPLKTSLVTGKDLPAMPYEFVYGNRLIRLGAESEKADFMKDPKKYWAELDKATIAAQSKGYALKTCAVSDEEIGAEAKTMVVGGRLISLCCNDCKQEVAKNPAKYIAIVDASRAGAQPKADQGDKKPAAGEVIDWRGVVTFPNCK